MGTKNVLRGTNVTVLTQLDNVDVKIRYRSWSVDEEITDGYDQVGGEKRGRPFRVTDGFKLTYNAYYEDAGLSSAWLASIANDDEDLTPLENVCGYVLRFRDGTRAAFKVSGMVTLGPYNLGYGARADAVMSNSYFRAQYHEAVPAIGG